MLRIKRLLFTAFISISSLNVSAELSEAEKKQMLESVEKWERYETILEAEDEVFSAKSKQQCIMTVFNKSFCDCMETNLGYRVSFRDYVFVRILFLEDEKIAYAFVNALVTNFKGEPANKKDIEEMKSHIDSAYEKCQK